MLRFVLRFVERGSPYVHFDHMIFEGTQDKHENRRRVLIDFIRRLSGENAAWKYIHCCDLIHNEKDGLFLDTCYPVYRKG